MRVPPQSVDAEASVLGGLMLAPDSLAKVAAILDEELFYLRDHRLIYRAILDLDAARQPYDAVTIGEWFEAHGLTDHVHPSYVIDLASTVPSAANIGAYAKIVRDKATLRKVIEVGGGMVDDVYDGGDSQAILDHAIRELMALSNVQQSCDYSLAQAVRMAWADAEEASRKPGAFRGVPSGYGRMDKRLGGFHKGDLVILGARPSMGKTALMVNMALNAGASGFSVGMISGEQSALQIGQRSISNEARVVAETLRNGEIEEEAWPRLTLAMRTLIERKVRIYDRSAPTLDEIGRVARRWTQEYGIAVLFVDYLQRIRVPKAENRIEEVAEVARGLKTLARDLDIPVVALAQVKAEVDKRVGDKRPGLGDIANSDEATREADLIGFLYRDVVYNPGADSCAAELNFEKNRHGPTGQFDLRFDGATMRFTEAPR